MAGGLEVAEDTWETLDTLRQCISPHILRCQECEREEGALHDRIFSVQKAANDENFVMDVEEKLIVAAKNVIMYADSRYIKCLWRCIYIYICIQRLACTYIYPFYNDVILCVCPQEFLVSGAD
jgi:hypothetical protein